ncbi:MAG: tripartite tricarboxylate transporter substrate-binding protein [Rhodospirillales bacterium]
MTRAALLAVAGLAALSALIYPAGPVQAQLLPCREISLVVPWNPGGATDVLFRILAERYNLAGHTPALKVRNVAGERGLAGARLVAEAAPDGCLMLAAHDFVTLERLADNTDIAADAFAPVARVASTPLLIAVSVKSGIRSVPDLAAFAKPANGAAPKLVAAGHPGSVDYFAIQALTQMISVSPEFRSYQNPRRMVRALIDGDISLAEVGPGAAAAAMANGSFRLLGVTSAQPVDEFPGLLTFRAQGIDFVYELERGIFAPKGTPAPVVQAIAGNIADLMAGPEMQAILKEKMTRATYLGPADFADRLARAAEAWKSVSSRIGTGKS